MMTSRRAWSLALAMIAVLAAAFLVDQPIARLMAGNDPHVVAVSHFITQFGEGAYILYPTGIIVIGALLLKRLQPDRRRLLNGIAVRSAFVFTSVAAAGLSDRILKVAFGRARPKLWLDGDNSGFEPFRFDSKFNSFPSGHTMTSFAAAIALSALFPRWRWLFFGFAFLIAASRLALDAHYPSDVAAGAVLGSAIAILIREWVQEKSWLAGNPAQDFTLASVYQESNSDRGK